MSDQIILELGDVITIQIKDEPTISNTAPYLISYIDADRIDLTNLETEDIVIIPLVNERIDGYEVERITLLTRNHLKGYALQHGLNTGKHIKIKFISTPETLVGEILETRNDIITILVADTLEILYIDFGYKGLPNEVEIKNIEIFKPVKKNVIKETSIEKIYEYLEKQPEFEGEQSVSITSLTDKIAVEVEGFNENMKPWISRVIRKYIDQLNAKELEKEEDIQLEEEIKEGEDPLAADEEPKGEPIIGMTEKTRSKLQYDTDEADRILTKEIHQESESKKETLIQELFEDAEDPNQPFYKYNRVYSLEEQIKDMLDDYLARIPTEKRTPAVLNKIHNIIQRYTQLRTIYVVDPPIKYPLYESIKRLDKSIGWLLPVVSQSLEKEQTENESFSSATETEEEESEASSEKDDVGKALAVFLNELKNSITHYNSEVDNRYEDYLLKIDTAFARIYNRYPEGTVDCILNDQVNAEMPVVSNLDVKPYLTKYLSTPIYRESICLLSILTLPYSVTRYSRAFSPLTTIYETANLMEGTRGLALFKMLKSSFINTVYIGGTTETEGEPISETLVDKTEINNYSLIGDKNIDNLLQKMLPSELNFEEFLRSIPFFVRGIGFSIYSICRQLEPYHIYFDRLKPDQCEILNRILAQRIKKYKRILKKSTDAFKQLKKEVTKLSVINMPRDHMKEVSFEYDKFVDSLLTVYQVNVSESFILTLTPEELISYVTNADCGEYYNSALCVNKLAYEIKIKQRGSSSAKGKQPPVEFVKEAQSAEHYAESFPTPTNEFGVQEAPVVPPVPPLPQLNQEEIIPETPLVNQAAPFDVNTNVAKGAENQEVLPPHYAKVTVIPLGKGGKEYCKNVEVVKIYIDKEDVSKDNGSDIVSTLLPSPRIIVNGDYAILLEGGPDAVSYYIRENNKWRADSTIKHTILYETPAMFCNMGLWCVRDFTSKQCVPMQDLSNYMVQQVLSQGKLATNSKGVVNVANRVAETLEEMPFDKINKKFIDYLAENYIKQTVRSTAICRLKAQRFMANDLVKYNLGLKRDFVDIVVSPNLDLFLSIIADKNFGRKQNDLVNFCVEYTRKNISSNNLETPYWRYCNETGVPLVPTSLYTIATMYNMNIRNKNKFQEELELVKKEVGILSEDGAYVIDKYTGFKISDIIFDVGEEYDDAGFLIKTRDVLVDQEKEEEELKKRKLIMTSPDAKYIRYIIGFIAEKMSINLSKQVEYIVKTVVYILLDKKPKEKDHDRYLMYLTLGMIVIAIQTSIPNIVSKKPFPNCKEKFIGFPLIRPPEGTAEDVAAIKYVACVIIKARQASSPWNVLMKLDVDGITDIIKKHIIDYLLPMTEVQSKLNEKTSYLISSKPEMNVIPEEHNIRKWTTYLPVLEKINIDQVRNVTEDVLDSIRARPTTEDLDLLFSKIYQYSLGIQSKIQTIVKKKAKDLLLKTSLNIPFVENACCIDHTPNSVLGYFEKEEPIIGRYIDIATELTNIIYGVNRAYKSPQIVSAINTKRLCPEIGTSVTQETIYAAFVHQIKQDIINDIRRLPEDKDTEVSSSTKGNKKDHVVKVFDTMAENIERLKDVGISYNKGDFERLLRIRFGNKDNEVTPENIYKPHKKTLIAIEEELEHLQSIMDTYPDDPYILPSGFITQFISAINVDKKGLSNLKTYLNNENKKMLQQIKTFFLRNKAATSKHIDEMFDNFVTPEIFLEMTQTFLENITQIYPTMIINKTKQSVTSLPIQKYWELSPQHETDLNKVMLEKIRELEPLYDNPDIVSLVTFMRDHTKVFTSLVKKMGIYYRDYATHKLQNAEQTVLDLAAVELLFKYFTYTIYFQYISLSKTQDGRVIPPKFICDMLDIFFSLFMNQKKIVNKEMKDVADSVINIKNIEKNRMLDELSRLTSDEHQSNKILKALKLKRWSVPKNLRSYTKSGYDKDVGIFDEDDAFSFDVEEDGGYGEEDTGENDESFAYDLDEEEEVDFDFDVDWRELIGEDDIGDEDSLNDGDYTQIDIEELNKESS
jgi:hypothetical protein